MASQGQGLGVVTTRGWLAVVAVGLLVMVIGLVVQADSVAWAGLVTASIGVFGLVGHEVFGG
jgi:hypothetical protein